ncbi:MAG: hypothetical protein PUP92_23560 [Rhizonema sp. PD38]|nr:hypothetical protein [Rhizonema sp. PD38]
MYAGVDRFTLLLTIAYINVSGGYTLDLSMDTPPTGAKFYNPTDDGWIYFVVNDRLHQCFWRMHIYFSMSTPPTGANIYNPTPVCFL